MRFISRRLRITLITLLLLITLLPSLAGRLALEYGLHRLGADDVTVRVFHLNLWNGRLTLKGLQADHPQRPLLRLDTLVADLDLSALFQRRLALETLQLKGIQLPLTEQDGRWQLGPLMLPAPDPQKARATDNTGAASPSRWQWGVRDLNLEQIDLKLDYRGGSQHLWLRQLALPQLSQWQADQLSELSLSLTLNGQPIQLSSQARPLDEEPNGSANLRIDQLALAPLISWLRPDIRGELNLNLDLHAAQQLSGAWQLLTEGEIRLTDAAVAPDDQTQVRLDLFEWQGSSGVNVVPDGESSADLSGRITLHALHLQQKETELRTHLTGQITAELTQAEQLHLRQQSDLRLTELDLKTADVSLTQQSLHWRGDTAQQLSGGVLKKLSTDGRLLLRDITLTQGGLKFSQGRISSEGKLTLTHADQLNYTGDLALENTAVELTREDSPPLTLQQVSTTWQGTVAQQLAADNAGQLTAEGALSLKGITFSQDTLTLHQEQIASQGLLQFQPGENIRYTGELHVSGTRLQKPPYQLTQQRTQWQGEFATTLAEQPQPKVRGSLRLDQLAIGDTQHAELVKLAALELSTLQIDPQLNAQIQNLQLSELLLQDASPLLSLGSVQLQGIQASPSAAAIEHIELNRLNTGARFDKTQQPSDWSNWLARLLPKSEPPSTAPQSTEQSTEQKKSDPPFAIRIDRFALNGPSQLRYEDLRTAPSAPINLTLNKLLVSGVDSTKPEQFVDINLEGRLNRFGDLSMNARYTPFADKPNGQWQTEISALEMPPLSGLMNLYTGYQIEQGQLNFSGQGKLAQGSVDASNKIVINKFHVERGDPDRVGAFNGRLGMPLELAVSILTDKQNNLTLEIPVKGALDDPEFGIQSVINILLGKIAKQGAMSYLSHLLQPYGVLLTLGQLAMDAVEAASVQLEPVPFDPGSAEVKPQQLDYLDKVANLLKSRSGIRLKVCGLAVTEDKSYMTALTEQIAKAQKQSADAIQTAEQQQRWLINLAQARGDAVKQHLIEQEQIAPERLYSCLGRIDLKDDKQPRVLVGL